MKLALKKLAGAIFLTDFSKHKGFIHLLKDYLKCICPQMKSGTRFLSGISKKKTHI